MDAPAATTRAGAAVSHIAGVIAQHATPDAHEQLKTPPRRPIRRDALRPNVRTAVRHAGHRPTQKGVHMNRLQKLVATAIAATGLALATTAGYAQQKSQISITRQPGILYLPSLVMEKQQLIEKQAQKLGVPEVKVEWINFNSGGAQTDALLAGNVDIVNTGVGNLLLLWDRTKGGVKGIVANSALPVTLISRDPRIKSLKDIGPNDKIAVPTVKVSTQAILLQMAAAQMFGQDDTTHFDANTVQLGHPDAVGAMSNPRGEISSHFTAPPYGYIELKTVPGAHLVATSPEIIGGPLTQSNFFTTTKFADANPKLIAAIRAASVEAIDFIKKDPRAAAEIYRELTKDKMSTDDILDFFKQPGNMEYGTAPQGTMKFATHLYKIGTLKTMPKAWTDYYLPSSQDLNGN
jgi:NitT/TauT family transport system substrate-binding protein